MSKISERFCCPAAECILGMPGVIGLLIGEEKDLDGLRRGVLVIR